MPVEYRVGRKLFDPELYMVGKRSLLGCSLMYEVNCITLLDKYIKG